MRICVCVMVIALMVTAMARAELMTNGGFESGTDGWYIWAENYPGSSIGIVSDASGAYEGEQYLVTSGTGAFEIAKSSATSLANTTYRMTMWIYPSEDCSDTYLEIGMQGWTNSVGVTVGTPSLVKGQWNKIQTTYTTGASGIDFQPHVYVWGLSSGTLAFDNISVSTITISPPSMVLGTEGGEVTFDVSPATAGEAWVAEVTEGGDWLSIVSGGSGSGDGVVTLSCAENTVASDNSRVGVVRISSASGVAYFNVSQSSPTPVCTVVDSRTDRLDTTANEAGADYVLHNGSVHVNGEVYTKFILSGTVTNWAGYTDSLTWAGTWPFVSLLGTDYFVGRDVPTDVDETMTSIFSYYGDTNYGNVNKQCGFAANSGFVFYRHPNTGEIGFVAEDCASAPDPGYREEMSTSLTDNTQFEYEITYNLDDLTMTVKLKDVGDSEWDTSTTISIGYRNNPSLLSGDAVYDDWSDLVFSIQMTNTTPISASTDTYGFDYTVSLSVSNMISGDANFDGAVDVGDLGILAANYGSTAKNWNEGDFTGDGTVDVGDLGVLAANYGTNASAANWDTDYAKVFGDSVEEEEADDVDNTLCSTLGLPLIAGLVLMGLMLVKSDM